MSGGIIRTLRRVGQHRQIQADVRLCARVSMAQGQLQRQTQLLTCRCQVPPAGMEGAQQVAHLHFLQGLLQGLPCQHGLVELQGRLSLTKVLGGQTGVHERFEADGAPLRPLPVQAHFPVQVEVMLAGLAIHAAAQEGIAPQQAQLQAIAWIHRSLHILWKVPQSVAVTTLAQGHHAREPGYAAPLAHNSTVFTLFGLVGARIWRISKLRSRQKVSIPHFPVKTAPRRGSPQRIQVHARLDIAGLAGCGPIKNPADDSAGLGNAAV